jgi:hypothetical protein
MADTSYDPESLSQIGIRSIDYMRPEERHGTSRDEGSAVGRDGQRTREPEPPIPSRGPDDSFAASPLDEDEYPTEAQQERQ